MGQLAFDEETARQLEALYRTRDTTRRRDRVLAALATSPGERILDVGCGPGFYCAELAQAVGPEGTVVGLDPSPQMLALAARLCEPHANVELREAHASSLTVPDESFDGVVCVQVLEYVEDLSVALAELYRVVRPGGRVVVWDIDWATVSWHSDDPARMQRVLSVWDEHLVHPSLPRVLAPALRSAGFEQVEMEAHSYATTDFDPESYGVAAVPIIERFVAGHDGVGTDEARAWAAEQRALGEQGQFYFACLQFSFTGTRPGYRT